MNHKILVTVGADVTDFTRKMKEAEKTTRALWKEHEEMVKAARLAGKIMVTAGTAIAGGLLYAATHAAGFEAELSKVKAISGATGRDMKLLSEKALEMGSKTKFSATESAQAFQYMAMAGWKTNEMLDGIEGVMYLAAAAGEDLALTSDIVTDALTAFGLEAKDASMFADVLAQTMSNSNTTVAMLGESFKYVAPVAGALGYTVQDTAVALGLMANAGIKGSQAGTSLRTMMQNLISPTDDAKEVMDKLGISVTDSEGNMKSFDTVMDDLRKSFSGLTEAQKSAYAETLFGKYAMSGALAVINASEKDYNKLAQAITNSEGAAREMAEVMDDNLMGAVTRLKSAWDVFMISIGRVFIPAIRKVIESITKLIEWFNNLSERTQKIISYSAAAGAAFLVLAGGILLIVAAIPTIVAGFNSLVAGLKIIGTVVAGLAGSISLPFTIAIAAIIALTVVIYKYWEPISDFFKKTWSKITTIFTDAFNVLDAKTHGWLRNGIQVYKDMFSTLIDVFKRYWQYVKETWSNGLDFLKALITLDFQGMVNAIKAQLKSASSLLKDSWKIIGDGMKDSVSKWSESVRKTFADVYNWINEKTNGFFGYYVGYWRAHLMTVIGVVTAFWTFVKDSTANSIKFLDGLMTLDFVKMYEAARDQLDVFRTFFSEVWTAIRDNLGQYIKEMSILLRDKLIEMKETWNERLAEWGEVIKEWFSSLPDKILEWLEAWRDAMNEWSQRQNKENYEQFKEWEETIRNWFQEIPVKIREWFTEWLKTISTWFRETKEDIVKNLSSWRDSIMKWFGDQPKGIRERLSTWWDAFRDWMSEIPSRISAKLEEWWQAFKDWFNGVPNKPEVKNAGKNMIDKVSEGNFAKQDEFMTKLGRLIIDVIKAAIILAAVAAVSAGRELIRDLISGITSMRNSLLSKARDLIQGVINFFNSINLWGVGRSIIQGLVNGIGSMAGAVWQRARQIGAGIERSIRNALGIKSPSRVMKRIGKWTGMGLVYGMEDTVKLIEREANKMADAAVPEIDMSYDTPSGLRSSLSSAVNGTVDVNSREEALVGAISSLERRLSNLEVVMDGRVVGHIVEPHVTERQSRSNYRKRRNPKGGR